MRKKNILENSSSYIDKGMLRQNTLRIAIVPYCMLYTIITWWMSFVGIHAYSIYILKHFQVYSSGAKMAGLLQSTTHCPPRLRYFLYWRTLASLILGGTWKEMRTLRLQRPLVLHLFRVWDLSLRQNNLRY